MNVFKVIPTADNTSGCALVAATDLQEAINTYISSAIYRRVWYVDYGCTTDIIASLECHSKNPFVLFDCIKKDKT